MEKYGFIVSDGVCSYRRTFDNKSTVLAVMSQRIRSIVVAQNIMSFEDAWEYVIDLSKRRNDVKVVLLFKQELPKKSLIEKIKSWFTS